MELQGRYKSISRSIDGLLCVTFELSSDTKPEEIETLAGKELVIEAKQKRSKRSNDANAYFWQLCDKIAKALGTDKDTIYHRQLRDYGVFQSLEVMADAIEVIKPLFRVMEIDHYYFLANEDDPYKDGVKMASVHGYIGSHWYDSKQMSELIDGTVRDAKELGIETMTPEQIAQMTAAWAAHGYGGTDG